MKISIHAPPRGATRFAVIVKKALVISIHAPPRGATIFKFNCCAKRTFQFTPLREGRRMRALLRSGVQNISIHAPPRGATLEEAKKKNVPIQFQFTPLREGRRPDGLLCRGIFPISIHAPPRGATTFLVCEVSFLLFQFTPLREGRHPPRKRRRTPCNFNSRPSARGDRRYCTATNRKSISIHAPPRGATRIDS